MRLHVTVSDEVGDAVLAVAQSERRPVSNAAAILLDEAISARKRKATRAEVRAVKLLPPLEVVSDQISHK